MKTSEKSKELKEQAETVSKKPQALPDDELEQVSGGNGRAPVRVCPECGHLMLATERSDPNLPGYSYRVVICPYCGFERVG